MTDNLWMAEAYALALKARDRGEVPVGAIVVSADNHVLGQGFNQVISTHDPTAHAEIVALRQAAEACKNYRLPDCTLYVTLEPCIMCAGALLHARIQRLVFACRDFSVGAAGSVYNVLKGSPQNHTVRIDEGPMQKECSHVLEAFFTKRR